ncbi:hypothetical protein BASA50_000766 [Batrachochytrium salamandrivorans]|uniref:Uncharacterized protein n=1 Tax=Batrachochytrium salamandrivorans TaxID=1357716 RepID=A0ABQ8ESV1_9FUNG|nr:hypothetical protein BASA50_000766 [Batrachochytrium salamandrivorans]
MSLKRRANSGSGSSPPLVTVPKRPFSDPFTETRLVTENLASTIAVLEMRHLKNCKPRLVTGSRTAIDATTKILNEEGTVIENVEKIRTAFYSASSACMWIFSELDVQLLQFKAGLTLSRHLADASQSVR